MHILLTGATGFLGQAIVNSLCSAGYQLTVTQRTLSNTTFPRNVTVVECDLSEADSLAALPKNVDVVIHAAAAIPERFDDLTVVDSLWQVNGLATLRLASWAKKVGIKRFVYCSSYSIYQRPLPYPIPETHTVYPSGPAAPYALSKLAGEAFAVMLADANFTICCLRFSAIYGGGMKKSGVLSAFIQKARHKQPIILQANPDSMFDFVHVYDAAQAVVMCLTRPLTHQIYNIGGGEGVTLSQLAQSTWAVFSPGQLARIQQVEHPASLSVTLLDIARARQELGYQPQVQLMDGLREISMWQSE